MEQYFLDWKNPGLENLRIFCVQNYCTNQTINLANVLLVLPTERSARSFLESLLDYADENNLTVIPPSITTVGAFINKALGLPDDLPKASARQLIWSKVLQSNLEKAKDILNLSTEEFSFYESLRWANILDRIYAELASGQVSFQKVYTVLESRGLTQELARWQTIENLIEKFQEEMETVGGDILLYQQKNLEAKNWLISEDVIIAGCIDLPEVACRVLDNCKNKSVVITFAPNTLASMFDSYGRIITKEWQKPQIFPELNNFYWVEKFQEQGHLVARLLADEENKFDPNTITIATACEENWHFIEAELLKRAIKVHPAVGRYASASPVVLLIDLIADYLEVESFDNFARLLRHSNFASQFPEAERLRAILDRYHQQHLTLMLNEKIPVVNSLGTQFVEIKKQTDTILKPLKDVFADFNLWCQKLLEIVENVFDKQNKSLGHEGFYEDLQLLAQTTFELTSVKDLKNYKLKVSELLKFISQQMTAKTFPKSRSDNSIDLVGWLELQLDSADFKIITDFTENVVPTSVSADWILPNGLREELGLQSNAKRLARDAYVLSVTCASSKKVKIIASKKNISDDFTLPSRLLFDLESKDLANNISQVLNQESWRLQESDSNDKRLIKMPPQPRKLESDPEYVSVTGLAEYLRCPYQYYLNRIERLEQVNDSDLELSALNFGNFLHLLLKDFGQSQLVDCADSSEIFDYLSSQLKDYSLKYFTNTAEPAVYIQMQLLKQRLQVFANKQAEWRREGWSIHEVEWSWDKQAVPIKTKKSEIFLTGRIDRIDYHSASDTYAIFDYKSSNKAVSAEKAHRVKSRESGEYEWRSLQLPAYYYAWTKLGRSSNVKLGYINISSKLEPTEFDFLDWQVEDFHLAERKLIETVQLIQEQVFWEPQLIPKASEPSARYFVGVKDV